VVVAVAVEAVAAAVDTVVANRAVVEVETAIPTEANLAVKTTSQARVRAKATLAVRNHLAATATKAAEKRIESFFF